jgi:anti-sigma B factor antagonist
MRWHVGQVGAWCVVTLSGDLELAVAPAFREALSEVVDGSGGMVVLDLAGVPFVDSSGLAVVIAAGRRCRDRGGELRLSGASHRLRTKLDLLGLTESLALFPTAAAAAEVGGQRPVGG